MEAGGEDMRLIGGSHCFVWGSMAALLYAGAANPDRGVNYLDLGTALADSNAGGDDPGTRLTSSDAKSASADLIMGTSNNDDFFVGLIAGATGR